MSRSSPVTCRDPATNEEVAIRLTARAIGVLSRLPPGQWRLRAGLIEDPVEAAPVKVELEAAGLLMTHPSRGWRLTPLGEAMAGALKSRAACS